MRYSQENHVDSGLIQNLESLMKANTPGGLKKNLEKLKKENKFKNSDRFLMELYSYLTNTKEKINTLYLLGEVQSKRALLFLMNKIEEEVDTQLVTAAIEALSKSESLLGLEFLRHMLQKDEMPYKREILASLSSNPLYPTTLESKKILESKKESNTLKIQVLLSMGNSLKQESLDFLLSQMHEFFEKEPALFNSALLAAGKQAQEKDLEKILDFPSHNRVFVKELQEYVRHRVEQKSSQSLSEIIKGLKNLETFSPKFRRKILDLFSFPKEMALAESKKCHLSPDQMAFVQLVYLKDKANPREVEFLKKEPLSPLTVAYFLPYLETKGQKEEILEILNSFNLEKKLSILEEVSFKGAFLFLSKELSNKKLEENEKISLVNTLVYQKLMGKMSEEQEKSLSLLLIEKIKTEKNENVRNRSLRALVEVGGSTESQLDPIKALYEKNQLNLGSYLLFLISLNEKRGNTQLIQILEKSQKEKDQKASYLILRTIAEKSKNLTCELPILDSFCHKTCQTPLLKVLSYQRKSGYEKFLLESLQSDSNDLKLLALKACENNPHESHFEELKKICLEEENTLQKGAFLTLCASVEEQAQDFVLEQFIKTELPRETLLCLLKRITPTPGNSTRPLADKLEKSLETSPWLSQDEEILTAALSLKDRLLGASGNHLEGTLTNEESHSLDTTIAQSLPFFHELSPQVKSVLRNAELTWERKDLFDALVDKSTMVIEYTKSLELMIEEKIARPLFQRPQALNSALQKRILSLELHENYISTKKFMDTLNLGHSFTEKTFPRHRALGIVRSCLGGQFAYEYHRTLDGIRSWGLMFLFFFRSFTSGSKSFTSLLPLKKTEDKFILELAVSLNALQEIRNKAAHRGTLSDLEKIASVREETFSLFKKIQSL